MEDFSCGTCLVVAALVNWFFFSPSAEPVNGKRIDASLITLRQCALLALLLTLQIRAGKKKTAFWGSSSLYYIYVYTNAHLMFSLGLCEKKKNASFFSFVFCFLKKKKDKTPFSRTFQQFSRLKNAQFPRTSYHSFVFFFPFSFYSSESKSNKKKSAPSAVRLSLVSLTSRTACGDRDSACAATTPAHGGDRHAPVPPTPSLAEHASRPPH